MRFVRLNFLKNVPTRNIVQFVVVQMLNTNPFHSINQAFFLVDPSLENNPTEINCGNCYCWALVAHLIFNTGQLCSVEVSVRYGQNKKANLSHAFIFVNGKYYDSEALFGVQDWRNLPFFTDWKEYLLETDLQVSPDEKHFLDFWHFDRDIVQQVMECVFGTSLNEDRC